MSNNHRYASQPKYHHLPTEEKPPINSVGSGANHFAGREDSDDFRPGRDREPPCGLGAAWARCRRVRRVRAHPNTFVALMGLLYLGVYGCSGVYLSAVISTIEKRFQLKSSESGLFMSLNDISALCGVLFVAHIGAK